MELTTPETSIPKYRRHKALGCIPKQPDSWRGNDAVRSNLNALLSEHVVCCGRDLKKTDFTPKWCKTCLSFLRDYHPRWSPLPGELDLAAGAWSAADVASKGYNSRASLKNLGRQKSAISNVGFSLFARRYSGNPRWFLFLRWLRCFSSAGNLTWFEIQKKLFFYCCWFKRSNTVMSDFFFLHYFF
jgi:hypothetical protein